MVTRLDANGRVACAYRMPPALGPMGRVVFCFVWGKRFVIMADKSTFALDMTTGRFAKPDELQVESPVYQCSTPGCIYVSNGSGDLWMFAEGKPVRRFSLLSNAPFAQARRHRYYAADDAKAMCSSPRMATGSSCSTRPPRTWGTTAHPTGTR